MNPCFKCENRHENCHAECDKYNNWVSENKGKRKGMSKQDIEYESYKIVAMKRMGK